MLSASLRTEGAKICIPYELRLALIQQCPFELTNTDNDNWKMANGKREMGMLSFLPHVPA